MTNYSCKNFPLRLDA